MPKKKRKKREIKYQPAPNTCCPMTSFEMIQDTKWITKTNISANKLPHLTDCLRRNPQKSTLTLALTEISKIGFEVSAPGDPFIAIHNIRKAILSQGLPNQQLLPVLTPPCGNKDCGRLQGDLEYDKDTFSGRLTPRKMTCARCGLGGVIKPEFLPPDFTYAFEGYASEISMIYISPNSPITEYQE